MSDVIPTDADMRAADLMFKDRSTGKYDVERIGHESARHRRVLNQNAEAMNNTDRCLNGDAATGYPGLRVIGEQTQELSQKTHAMVCELYENNTGKKPRTDTALVKKGDVFSIQFYGVVRFVMWTLTAGAALVTIVASIVAMLR